VETIRFYKSVALKGVQAEGEMGIQKRKGAGNKEDSFPGSE